MSVMPDAHLGKGVTIGTVFASEEYVCPNAVGVDIGCGMAAVPIRELFRKQLTDEKKNKIFQRLKERIPTGFAKHDNMLHGRYAHHARVYRWRCNGTSGASCVRDVYMEHPHDRFTDAQIACCCHRLCLFLFPRSSARLGFQNPTTTHARSRAAALPFERRVSASAATCRNTPTRGAAQDKFPWEWCSGRATFESGRGGWPFESAREAAGL